MKRKANRRPPRQNTDGRKERKPMEGTQFLYCEKRKGQPRVSVEVCLNKCKKAKKCKTLEEIKATMPPEFNEHLEKFIDLYKDLPTPKELSHPKKRDKATGNPELNRPQDGRYKTRSKPLPLSKKETEKYETIRQTTEPQNINFKKPFNNFGEGKTATIGQATAPDLENFIDNELDKERRADPLHPINRQQLKTPGEEEILLDSERGIQLALFNFVEKEGNE